MKLRTQLLAVAMVAANASWTVGPAFAQDVPQIDPLTDIGLDMHVVVGKLQKLVTDSPTQATQRDIVAKLDKLIEDLEKQCKSCNGACSTANPNRPLMDSRIIGGPGGVGNLHSTRNDGKKWAELPPKDRDRIQQSLTEGFPPHYQAVLERYYKRLAEEKPVGDADAPKSRGAKAADKPQASVNGRKAGGGAQ